MKRQISHKLQKLEKQLVMDSAPQGYLRENELLWSSALRYPAVSMQGKFNRTNQDGRLVSYIPWQVEDRAFWFIALQSISMREIFPQSKTCGSITRRVKNGCSVDKNNTCPQILPQFQLFFFLHHHIRKYHIINRGWK